VALRTHHQFFDPHVGIKKEIKNKIDANELINEIQFTLLKKKNL